MNHARAIMVLGITGILLLGCNSGHVIHSGTATYPPETAGIWKTQDPQREWIIKVEPDGSISRVFHPLAGPIRITEGGANLEGPDPGTFAVFVMGECKTEYRPFGRILKATVNLENYHFKLPQGELQGRSESYFEGPVSKDGKTWTAKLRDFTYLDGADKPDRKMIEENPETIIFEKVTAESFKPLETPATEDSK